MRQNKLILFLLLLCCLSAPGATYYVATNGNDTANGAIGTPFLTVQKGVNTATNAGDTVLVGAGTFNELVYTKASGSAGSPITINGQNLATVKACYFTNAYVNWVNFRMAGQTNAYAQTLYLKMGAHNCVLSNNVIDGEDVANVYKLRWETPTVKPFDTNAASDCLVVSNRFVNHNGNGETPIVTMYGDRNTLYGNQFRDMKGGDIMRIWGRTNHIAANTYSNLFYVAGLTGHSDWVQVFGVDGTVPYYGSRGHIFESNRVEALHYQTQLMMSEEKGETNICDWVFRNNVFVGVAMKGTMNMAGVRWLNNTFINCATNTSGAGFVLIFGDDTGASHGGQAINNAFIDCGGVGETNNGWYTFVPGLTNVIADYNFVTKGGSAVVVDAQHRAVGDVGGWYQYAWWEPHGLNGGDPKVFSMTVPDLRLLPDSPLIGAGTNLGAQFTVDIAGNARGTAWDIGAHEWVEYTAPDSFCAVTPKTIRAFPVAKTNAVYLFWPTNYLRQELRVARRQYTNDANYWNQWVSLYTNTATSSNAYWFIDTNVAAGVAYEYSLASLVTNWPCADTWDFNVGPFTNSSAWYYQYITTGSKVPLKDARGAVILLVQSNLVAGLAAELATLTNDLVGDGYKVFRHDVPAVQVTDVDWASQVAANKALIAADYATDTNQVWSVFLIGHVAVPYSGDTSPGSHAENYGAHAADWYYAVLDSSKWTDSTVNDSTATNEYSHNWNVPGDGKWDQNQVPGIPNLRIGRVDMTNLPAFSKSQAELISQYLTRNHNWRHKVFTVRDRAMVNTNGIPYEGHDMFASVFGTAGTTDSGLWLNLANSAANSYLLATSYGNGRYPSHHQQTNTTGFAASPLYAVFTSMYGSYFGDWDSGMHQDEVMHAPLGAAGYALTCWYRDVRFASDIMAMGETIGDELYTMAAANSAAAGARYYQLSSPPANNIKVSLYNYSSLMGDPTLRLRVVAPPSNVAANNGTVTWTSSPESGVIGYHVYRAPASDLNSMIRLTTVPTNSPFVDTAGNYTYMVRAVKLEDTAQRSFYNVSQGIMASNSESAESPVVEVGAGLARAGTFRAGHVRKE